MPPKKKKASGDASKGEKVFKNLCGVCHSLSVSLLNSILTTGEAENQISSKNRNKIQKKIMNMIDLLNTMFLFVYRLILLVQLSVVLEDPTSLPVKDSVTHLLSHPRLPSSGLLPTWIDGSNPHLISLQETPWLSLVSHQLRTEPISSLTLWAEIILHYKSFI